MKYRMGVKKGPFKVFSPLSPHIDCGQMFWGWIGVPETVEHEPLVSPNGGECTVVHSNALYYTVIHYYIAINRDASLHSLNIKLFYTAICYSAP